MEPCDFVEALRLLHFENTFNPYSNRCAVHDLEDAPRRRAQALRTMLEAASKSDVDALWIGRDLGYRGGRRTGLALTDDVHISDHGKRWGISVERPTKGQAIAERTAAIIWKILSDIDTPVFLWNVFPLHPHESNDPFSNRLHNNLERKAGEEFLNQLILLLRPHKLIAIGNDASITARRLAPIQKIVQVRHPSYGGQGQFIKQMRDLYNLPEAAMQTSLF
jgi:hypothetical protein